MKECCHHQADRPLRKKSWYAKPLFIVTAIAVVLYTGGFFLPFLKPFQEPFIRYIKLVWWAMALGFLFAGVIECYIPPEYVSKLLARPKKRTVFLAASLGLVMSACSHGILAIAMELHKKGASGPAIISFLLGSPWANLPVTLILVSLFHVKGLVIIASALLVSIVTGLLFLGLASLGWIEKNPSTLAVDKDFSIRRHLQKRWKETRWTSRKIASDIKAIFRGALSLADMILWWLVLGIVLAGLVGAYVPSHIFQNYLGPTFAGLLLTLAAATVIEICSEGSAPLAFEVYRQTGSLGNTFAFLMGGFVTDYTEVGLIWKNIGRRTALWMVGLTVPQVLLLGWLYNLLHL